MKNLKKLSSKRSLVNLGHVTSTRYKMYKSGRFWVFAGMTSFVLLIGGGTVKADTVASNNSGTTVAVSASSAGADNNRVVLAATNSSGSSKATPAVSNDDSASTTPQTADSDNQSIVHASSGANQESNNATSALTPTNSATSTSVVNQSSVSNQSTAPSTAAAITTRDADVTESSSVGVTDPEISVAEDELWSGLSSMQVNLTLNYSDTVNIPKGTRIVLHFTNPGIIDWSTLAAVTLPKYLTQTIDAATGTVTLVYNNAILDQSGQLGISYIAKVANPAGTNYGKTYMNATLITPDNQTVDFTAPADPITVNDLTSSGASVITTYWPGGENYGATGAATLLNDTNTPQPTGQPSVDSYGNNDDIISVGSFTNNGSTLPAMVDLNLNWTSDWASQLMQLNTSSEMSNYINADGTFNYDSSNSVDSGFFATTIKVNGNLKLTTADIHLYLPDTGEDVTNDYYIEELGDGVFGIMLKTNTAITSVAAEYPRTVIYLTPEVTGALATEPTDGTTDPNATSSIVANVIWYPSDAPTGYYVQNKTTLVPTWSPNAYSTSFVPKISGFGDQTVVSGQSITTATLLRGVTASDVEDGDLTSKLSIVDLGGLDLANPTAGTYQVEVEVTDSDGNVTTATATITVHNLASYNIIEKFQDANGKTIAPDESTTMAEGDFKEFTAPVITGYTFVSVSPSADVIATQDETLIFTYDQNAVVTLSGTDGKVYDGTSGSIDVSKYQVILPDGINYELQSGDLQFSSTNPIVVGTYGVKISAQGLANMQAATTGYNLSVGEDNAEYSITPAPVSAVLSGTDSKVYDGKVGTINPSKYTITLSNGESYSLTAADLQFVESDPSTVGTYHVELSAQGLADLNSLSGNYVYTQTSVTGRGTYSITPAPVSAVLSGTDSKVYDGKVGTINPSKYTITLSNGESYSLTAADLQFVESDPSTVGTYHVELSAQGLANLNSLSGNYVYTQTSVTGRGTYHITPAPVSAVLSGTDSKVYDGKVGTINPSKYTITLSNGESYSLTAADLQFVESDPSTVGTYHVELSAQGLANLNKIDGNYTYTTNTITGQGMYKILPNSTSETTKPSNPANSNGNSTGTNVGVAQTNSSNQASVKVQHGTPTITRGGTVNQLRSTSIKRVQKLQTNKLPQTNEQSQSILTIVGLALAGLLFNLFGIRKKKSGQANRKD